MTSERSHTIIEGRNDCGLILLCDHATNVLPPEYGTLGLPQEQLERHIGYDIGAGDVTMALAERFDAPAVMTTYSRLLIDPNRGEDDPTLIMRLSDGAVIPGNARLDGQERQARLDRFYRPYHQVIDEMIAAALATGTVPVLVSIHSFTHSWRGKKRPWHVGCLWDLDDRAVRPFIAELETDPSLVVGDNEPYDGALRNDCMYRHGNHARACQPVDRIAAGPDRDAGNGETLGGSDRARD